MYAYIYIYIYKDILLRAYIRLQVDATQYRQAQLAKDRTVSMYNPFAQLIVCIACLPERGRSQEQGCICGDVYVCVCVYMCVCVYEQESLGSLSWAHNPCENRSSDRKEKPEKNQNSGSRQRYEVADPLTQHTAQLNATLVFKYR